MPSFNHDGIGPVCPDEEENDTTFTTGSDPNDVVGSYKPNQSRQIFVLKAIIGSLLVGLIATTTMSIVFKMNSKKEGFNKEQFDSFAGKVLGKANANIKSFNSTSLYREAFAYCLLTFCTTLSFRNLHGYRP